jgi:hypothetical protein
MAAIARACCMYFGVNVVKILEKKGMLQHANSKIYAVHAVTEKQIMTNLRHRSIVQVVVV